jgi:hypothetical protein
MSRLIRPLAVSALSAVLLLTAGALPALARTPTSSSGTGNDISWPQCGKSYPSGQAFGIVGLNGGLANDLNGCFSKELSWAAGSSGKSAPGSVPKAMLYVNTADPGQVTPTVADWPSNDADPNKVTSADPYGTCAGADDLACSWQYGWDRAIQDMMWLAATSARGASNIPAAYWWWLDVETGNSWETTTANNVADLEGMVAAFTRANETYQGVPLGGVTTVGIYSTSYQWGQITGSAIGATSQLVGLPDWIPGAGTLTGAQADCALPTFTSGHVLMTQWFGKPFDGDYACKV